MTYRYLVKIAESWQLIEFGWAPDGWAEYVSDAISLKEPAWVKRDGKLVPWYMNKQISESDLLMFMLQVETDIDDV